MLYPSWFSVPNLLLLSFYSALHLYELQAINTRSLPGLRLSGVGYAHGVIDSLCDFPMPGSTLPSLGLKALGVALLNSLVKMVFAQMADIGKYLGWCMSIDICRSLSLQP